MSTVNATFNTSHIATDLVKKSFAGMITRLMPNGTAPLFALSSMLGTDTATDVEHGFFSKTMVFPELTINGALTNESTLVGVDSSQMLPGMILRNNTTGENMIVNSVPDGTAVMVSRNVGGTSHAVIADAEILVQVGNAFEESSVRPAAMSVVPTRITNFTQIFRNTWALSGTSQAVQTIAGDGNEAENRQDCAAFHAGDIEKALFFGVKSQGIRNGQPFRTMDGLINMIGNMDYYPASYATPNVFSAGATTNHSQLEAMLDPVANQTTDPKGANERVLFTGGTALKAINNIGRLNGQYQLVDGQTNFGLRFKTLTMTRCTFRLIEHPLFNTNAIWSKMAVAIDLPTFKMAYLGNRKTQNREFNKDGKTAQDNGIDAVGGTLLTEATATSKNIPANAVIYGLTNAAQG